MRKKIDIFLNLSLILLSTVLLFQSCIETEEDISDCSGKCRLLLLEFDYHMGDNDFVGEIDVVSLYFFDKQDKFLHVMPVPIESLGESKHEIKIDADYRDCKVVAWGGLSDNNNQIEYPSLSKGDSIELLTFKLKTEGGDISPDSLAPMFFGGQEVLSFSENNGTSQTLSFLRNNNVINFSVVTTDGDDVDLKNEYEAKIYAPNGDYRSNNDIVENSRLIAYHSVVNELDSNVITFNTLRFNELHSEETQLVIIHKKTGKPVLSDTGVEYLRLINLLIKRKPSPEMPNQEYLDRESVWDIKIVITPITYVVVSVIINDWIITDDVDIPDFE